MDDLRARAELVAFDSAGAVGTVVTRAEVAEAAAGSEFPATLLLDLDRFETAEDGEVMAHATLAVDWDREELERLLSSTDDEEIGLWFDEGELAEAFDEAEVEAHGFRRRAAVLAVAATAAGTSATPALARMAPGNEGGGGGTPAGAAVLAQPAGAERGLLQDQRIGGTPARATGTAVTSSGGTGTLSTGELAAAVAGGALLIAAAGFGAARRRTPPAQPV